MTTKTKTKPKAIPTRDSIEDKHKWDLTDLYESDENPLLLIHHFSI